MSLIPNIVVNVIDEEIIACRICLIGEGNLYDIQEWGLNQAFINIMGIPVEGRVPQYLCIYCRTLLAKAWCLREKCHRADAVLREMSQNKCLTSTSIRTIDRTAHQLTYELTQTLTDVQNYSTDPEADSDDPQPHFTLITPGDSEHFDIDSIAARNVIQGETNDKETPIKTNKKPSITAGNIDINTLKIETNKRRPILPKRIRDMIAKKKLKLNKTRMDDGRSNKRPPIKGRGKSDKNSDQTLIKMVDAGDNLCEEGDTDNIELLTGGEVSHIMAPVTQMIENEADKEPSAVKKKKRKIISGIPTIEACEVFARKHNFKAECLTYKEMVEDMVLRRMSDRFKTRKHKCTFCYRGFMTSATFENHMSKFHNPMQKDHECDLCNMSYSSDFKLRRHMRFSHEVRYTCAECGYIAWDKTECLGHAAKHDLRQCKFCENSFRNGSTFAWHMRVAHSLENAASGSCEECGEIFTGEKGLRAHKLLKHNKVPAAPGLQCARCRIVFDGEEALRVHSEPNGGKCDLSMSACTACGLACSDPDDLLRHMRDEHQLPVHTCYECLRLFRTESSLSTHVDRVHRGIKPQHPNKMYQYKKGGPMRDFVCCGRVFPLRAQLKSHQASHTGNRRFKCSVCPKSYPSSPQLKEHLDVHAGLRRYRCPECPKTYFRQASIYKHRLVHTGERPFVCHICHKTFNQSGSLSSHIKYVHMKVKPPPRRRRGGTEA